MNLLKTIFCFILLAGCAHKQVQNRFIASVSDQSYTEQEFLDLTNAIGTSRNDRDRIRLSELEAQCMELFETPPEVSSGRHLAQCAITATVAYSFEMLSVNAFSDRESSQRNGARRMSSLELIQKFGRRLLVDMNSRFFERQNACLVSQGMYTSLQAPNVDVVSGVVQFEHVFNDTESIATIKSKVEHCLDEIIPKIRRYVQNINRINIEDKSIAYRRARGRLDRFFPAEEIRVEVETEEVVTEAVAEPSLTQSERRVRCILEVDDEIRNQLGCNNLSAPMPAAPAVEVAPTVERVERLRLTGDLVVGSRYLDTNMESQIEACHRAGVPCDNAQIADLVLETHQEFFRNFVKSKFSEQSQQYQNIILPLTELKQNLATLDLNENWGREDLARTVQALEEFAEIDAFENMGQYLFENYQRMVRADEVVYIRHNFNTCINSLYHTIWQQRVIRSGYQQGLLGLLNEERENHPRQTNTLRHLRSLSSLFASNVSRNRSGAIINGLRTVLLNSELGITWARDEGISCFEQANDQLIEEFRDNLISRLPNGPRGDYFRYDREFRVVMRGLVDIEMLDLIMRLDSNPTINSDVTRPWGEMVMTQELAFDTVFRIVEKLGNYLEDGFVYNSASFVTALGNLKGELKEMLRVIANSNREIRVSQLDEFFAHSNAMAIILQPVLSKYFFQKFERMVERLKYRHMQFLRTSSRYYDNGALTRAGTLEIGSINASFTGMVARGRTLVQSFDFARIIRPENRDTRRLFVKFAEEVFIPFILGRRDNLELSPDVDDLLKQRILPRNASGDIMGVIVDNVASHELRRLDDRNRRPYIRPFYDQHDFSWTTLRSTVKGQEAVRYYVWRIIEPQLFGNDLSQRVFEERHQYFLRLIEQAQEENED